MVKGGGGSSLIYLSHELNDDQETMLILGLRKRKKYLPKTKELKINLKNMM